MVTASFGFFSQIWRPPHQTIQITDWVFGARSATINWKSVGLCTMLGARDRKTKSFMPRSCLPSDRDHFTPHGASRMSSEKGQRSKVLWLHGDGCHSTGGLRLPAVAPPIKTAATLVPAKVTPGFMSGPEWERPLQLPRVLLYPLITSWPHCSSAVHCPQTG